MGDMRLTHWLSLAAITSVMTFGAPVPVSAEAGARCSFEFIINLDPGMSYAGSVGSHASEAPGTVTCDGLINGQQPTGAGVIEETGRYGTAGPDTCQEGGEGDGTDILKIPTAAGLQTVVSDFTFTFGGKHMPKNGGVAAGEFKGTHFTGTFEFTPTEGDCITAPVTKAKVFGTGVVHD